MTHVSRFLSLGLLLFALLSVLLSGCAHQPFGSHPERGMASWYGPGLQGRRTASGERFDMYKMTAAHRSLPIGTNVRVKAVATGRDIVVRINDRGPASRSRLIDLSYAAAKELGILNLGLTLVEVNSL